MEWRREYGILIHVALEAPDLVLLLHISQDFVDIWIHDDIVRKNQRLLQYSPTAFQPR